jgi:Secretion system C-terminal sorting domain
MKQILFFLLLFGSYYSFSQTQCSKVTVVSGQISIDIQGSSNFTLGAGDIFFTTSQPISLTPASTSLPGSYVLQLVDLTNGDYKLSVLSFAPSQTITTAIFNLAKVNFSGTLGTAVRTSESIFKFDGILMPISETPGCSPVLPTELLTFKGIKKGAVSQLQWEATNEKNLINYIVERSADGRNFHPIGFNKPKAVSSLEKATYDFIDDQPEIGLNYYRLLSKGFGKDEKYSKVISLDFGIGLSGRAFPNPLDGDLTIELDIENGSGEVVVGIYDIAGRQVVSKKIQNSDRRLNIPLPTADLPPGSYLVRVKAGVFSWERQITKM